MRGYQTVPALMPDGLYEVGDDFPGSEALCGRIFQQYHQAAIAALERGSGLAVDYAELPGAVAGKIASHFGLTLGDGDTALLAGAAGYDAKAPHLAFVSDTEQKQSEASAAICEAARLYLERSHARLTTLAGASRLASSRAG